MTEVVEQNLEAGRAAFARHEWSEAYERFTESDRVTPLGPADLESYADAAWWSGHGDAVGIRERQYAAHLERKDPRGAAMVALRLVEDNATRAAFTVAGAWLQRAERLLANDTDAREYGHLRLVRGLFAGGSGDPDTAIAEARAALEYGERYADRDLQALALTLQGQGLITKGQVAEAMPLMDQATVAAVSGELQLFTTGVVYCSTIGACRDLADYARANEWTEAALRWCERQSVNGFPGICRVHRAEILALRGALARAEQEARLAHDELVRFDVRSVVGDSLYEIGFIRLRMGDLPAAEEAFRDAHAAGRLPEPGLSLVRLAEGKAASANTTLKRALADERSRPGRARLLPAQVEVALAAGDLETARAATAELAEIAPAFGTPALKATSRDAAGALLLAEGNTGAAETELRQALGLWNSIDAPYEAARTRMLIARARRASNDPDGAALELSAAKTAFERIGARRDAREAARELGDDASALGARPGARVTRTFLFTDIVRSTDLVRVIGDTAWQDLIRWHDDTLRAVVAEHGGEEIRHQGDGLAVSFADPARAIACAIAIQRRLADHRRAQGFAPSVRIGMHQAEATKRGLDYAGVGVHAAARVGALAGDGEILVTRDTLDAAKGNVSVGDARTVELKGIEGAVEVLPVLWR